MSYVSDDNERRGRSERISWLVLRGRTQETTTSVLQLRPLRSHTRNDRLRRTTDIGSPTEQTQTWLTEWGRKFHWCPSFQLASTESCRSWWHEQGRGSCPPARGTGVLQAYSLTRERLDVREHLMRQQRFMIWENKITHKKYNNLYNYCENSAWLQSKLRMK